jgi:hypothetical protein
MPLAKWWGVPPASYSSNPATANIVITAGTTFSMTNPRTAQLADKGRIAANVSYAEVLKAGGQLKPHTNGASIQPVLQFTQQVYSGIGVRLGQKSLAVAGSFKDYTPPAHEFAWG